MCMPLTFMVWLITQDANGNDTIIDGLFAVAKGLCIGRAPTARANRRWIWLCSVARSAPGESADEVSNIAVKGNRSGRRLSRLAGLNERTTGEDVAPLRKELQNCMQNLGIPYRRACRRVCSAGGPASAYRQCQDLGQEPGVQHRAHRSAEPQNLLEVAEAIYCRGERVRNPVAHAREDFKERDDENWRHTLYSVTRHSVP